ncbi:MAG: PAS domain S-box protein, partial [Chloroflexota bacterium]
MREQKRNSDELEESEARFRAMFHALPVGVSVIDAEGRYIAVNQARQDMLGFSEEELLGAHYMDHTLVDDVSHDLKVNAEALEQGLDRFQLEKRFVRKDGSVVWTRISASRVRDEQGNHLYSISVAEDISEWKRVEEERGRMYALELQALAIEERLAAERKAILGQITEGIVVANPEGRLTFVNAAARTLLGGIETLDVPIEQHSETYNLFTPEGEIFPPENLPLSRAIRNRETVTGRDILVRRPDGTESILEASATPVLGEDGSLLGGVVLLRDITDELLVERQKDEFLSALAHDLRTPLTTIKGRVQMLRRRVQLQSLEPAQLLDGLTRIDAGAERMTGMINELLEVANIELGRPLNLTREPTNIAAIVRQSVQEFQQGTNRHSISLECSEDSLIGLWDRVRLERILSNLLSNAIKYSP